MAISSTTRGMGRSSTITEVTDMELFDLFISQLARSEANKARLACGPDLGVPHWQSFSGWQARRCRLGLPPPPPSTEVFHI